MCERCNKYLSKQYKSCPKCGGLLTTKFDYDKKIIEELERISENVGSVSTNQSFVDISNQIYFDNYLRYNSSYSKDEQVPAKYFDLRKILKNLILPKIQLDKNDSLFIGFNTNWEIKFSRPDLKEYVEQKLIEIMPIKLILLNVKITKTKDNKIESCIKPLFFTENEMENAFEFFRGKNWLSEQLSFFRTISGWDIIYNTSALVVIPLEGQHIDYETQWRMFSKSNIFNVFCMRKILIQYKDLITNELILKQIEPMQNENKSDDKLTQK